MVWVEVWGWKKTYVSFTFPMLLGFFPHNYNSAFPPSHGSIFPHIVLQNHEAFSDPPYSGRVLLKAVWHIKRIIHLEKELMKCMSANTSSTCVENP